LASLLAGWLLAGAALAGTSGVKDVCQLFSPAACAEAENKIAHFRNRTNKDLLVETIPSLTEEQVKHFHSLGHPKRAHFWRSVAQERAKQANLDGVYVFLCEKPEGHMVIAWPVETEKIFSREDQGKVDKQLRAIQALKHNADTVLLDVIQQVDEIVSATLREQAGLPAEGSFHWTWVLWGVGGLFFLWMVAGLFRARIAARQGTPLSPSCPTIDSMFGITAGLWLYQKFITRGARSSTPGLGGSPEINLGPQPPPVSVVQSTVGPPEVNGEGQKSPADLGK
jgi:uncharacterized membrane protein YgcG